MFALAVDIDCSVKTLEQNPPGVEQPRATCLRRNTQAVARTSARESIALGQGARMHRMHPRNNMLYHQALFMGSDAP